MESFADAVCLRMANLGFAMIDTFDGQVKLILMMLGFSFVFRSSVSEDPQQGYLVFLEEGQHPIIEHIGRSDGVFGLIELGEGHPGIGVDKGLLINSTDALDIAYVVGVLGT